MFPSETEHESMVTLESERTGVIDEPSFRMLLLGDWSGDAAKAELPARRLIEIDRDNFDETIAKLKVRLELEMQDGTVLPLEFNELDDFHPDQIFRRVPLFAELRDLRRRLNSEDAFNTAAGKVRAMFRVSEPETPVEANQPGEETPIAADNLLDAILAKPSGGAPAPKPGVSSEIGGLISELVRPHLVSVDENERSALVAAVDEATSSLMRMILHHKRFQELEAAWRGLYFLIGRTETSSDLKIFIFDISKDELAVNLKSAGDLSDTVLCRHLIRDTIETPGGEPWAAVFGVYAFAPSVDDIAGLIRLGKLAAAANAPFISHMRPDILGVHSLAESPDASTWKMNAERDEGKLWAALRGQPESEYLGMAIPRFLVRMPYGANTDPLEAFSFEEFKDMPVHDDYLWANPAFIVAILLANSYSAYGWEMGRSLLQDVEGLPVHIYREGTETVFKPCSEILMTQTGSEALMEYGLIPLISYKNTDHVKLGRFQSIADPTTGLKGIWTNR